MQMLVPRCHTPLLHFKYMNLLQMGPYWPYKGQSHKGKAKASSHWPQAKAKVKVKA